MRDEDASNRDASNRNRSELQEALNSLHISALQLRREAKRLEQVTGPHREDSAMPGIESRLLVNQNGRLTSNKS